MAVEVQPNWQRIARDKYAGFQILGTGRFAVPDFYAGKVQLFEHLLLANATGRKVIELNPPKSTRTPVRQIHIRD